MSELLNDYFGTVFTVENQVNELSKVKNIFNQDNSHMLYSMDILHKKVYQ